MIGIKKGTIILTTTRLKPAIDVPGHLPASFSVYTQGLGFRDPINGAHPQYESTATLGKLEDY